MDTRKHGELDRRHERIARAQDRRDRTLLRRLASARESGDAAGTRAAIAELLRPLWPSVCAQIAMALRLERVQQDDLEDIAIATMMRLLFALANERDLEVSLRGLVRSSVKFEVYEFRRRVGARAKNEELRDPAELPETLVAEIPGPLEQADALEAMLMVLSARDRTIFIERELLDRPVAAVARSQQMNPDAVRQVYSRSLALLRRAANVSGGKGSTSIGNPTDFRGPVTKPPRIHD
jgi:DNA-directed RNA polymerase specialized sigma24 family protein